MKFIFGILGIVTALNGISIINDPIWCSGHYDYCADFTGYNVPFGVFLILVGLFVVFAALFGKRYSGDDTLICILCKEPSQRKDTQSNQCPNCMGQLESLEGFYDRHPELKDK